MVTIGRFNLRRDERAGETPNDTTSGAHILEEGTPVHVIADVPINSAATMLATGSRATHRARTRTPAVLSDIPAALPIACRHRLLQKKLCELRPDSRPKLFTAQGLLLSKDASPSYW
jgi:hypothetical protein